MSDELDANKLITPFMRYRQGTSRPPHGRRASAVMLRPPGPGAYPCWASM